MTAKKIDRISIITTFYNAERFIINAINSVFNQKIVNFEIEYVIVDDKSQDSSRMILNKYIEDHQKPNFIWKLVEPNENLGCGGARKFGIDNATGKYFMFLDADDYYINFDFVNRAFQTIKTEHADIVEWGILFNQANGQQINNTSSQKIEIENNPTLALICLFKDNLIKFNVWSKIYTRSIIESYPYSTSRTYEDVRTIPVWVSNANKIIIMPFTEINYRAASGSIIREDMVKTRLGTITAIAELFERFKTDYMVLKSMYARAMVDLEAILHNHSSKDPGFIEMSKLNTKMLSYLYPKDYKTMTFDIEDLTKDKNPIQQDTELEMK